jgi:hypothetical protein
LSFLGKVTFSSQPSELPWKEGEEITTLLSSHRVAATAAAPTTAHNGHPSSFQAPCAAKQPFVADIRFHLLTG